MSHIGVGWEYHQLLVPHSRDGMVGRSRERTTIGHEPHLTEPQPKSKIHLQQLSQAELRQKLQINRASWLANASSSPLSQYRGKRFLNGKISGYAVMMGLAAMISLTGSSLFLYAGGASRLAKTTPAPTIARAAATNITLSKVASR